MLPCISHLSPHNLHLIPCTSQLQPHILHLTTWTSHLAHHNSNLTPCTSHNVPHTLHFRLTSRCKKPAPGRRVWGGSRGLRTRGRWRTPGSVGWTSQTDKYFSTILSWHFKIFFECWELNDSTWSKVSLLPSPAVRLNNPWVSLLHNRHEGQSTIGVFKWIFCGQLLKDRY